MQIPRSELTWRFSRSSGPGGQHVNTADTRVELLWDLSRTTVLDDVERARAVRRLSHRLSDGVLTVSASEHRSQHRNRETALRRLDVLVTEAVRPNKKRRPTKPTKSSQRRRLESKRHRSETKRLRRRPE